MPESYFTTIAVVNAAAEICGFNLKDNYAYMGALERFARINTVEAKNTDIDDNDSEILNSFLFGVVCGKHISRLLSEHSRTYMIKFDAIIAKNTLLDMHAVKNYNTETMEKSLITLFRSLLKYAQIRTHTAKPGDEDIHQWIEDYYDLYSAYNTYIKELVNEIITPSVDVEALCCYDPSDTVIKILNNAKPLDNQTLKTVLEIKPNSVFGKIICNIVKDL